MDKTAKENETASVGKGLQLTPPIANYQDIENKKQFGIMLYTRANYTSVIDPLTGWRKTIYLKKGSEEFTKKEILENFTDIGFDGKDYYFEYIEKHTGKKWKMYSGSDGVSLPRYQNNKKQMEDNAVWEPEKVDVNVLSDELFIVFDKEKSLRTQIANNEHQLNKISSRKETAWDSLRYVIETIQHTRNTGKTEEYEILFSKETSRYVLEREWHKDQIIKQQEDGSVLLKFKSNQSQMIYTWLLSFGNNATVIKPEELREKIRAECEKVAEKYVWSRHANAQNLDSAIF